MNNKFVIGTAQFGFKYGISNYSIAKIIEVKKIINYCKRNGISTLDTASSYGRSEKILGKLINSKWKIFTKISRIPKDVSNVDFWVKKNVYRSLNLLKASKIDTLYLHYPSDLLNSYGAELHGALKELKRNNIIKNIGISIYQPQELDLLYGKFNFDVVQVPFNVLDRRILESGWLKRLHREKVKVHVRSVFLQGILLMEQNILPKYFKQWNNLWIKWHRWLEKNQLSSLEACLGYILTIPNIDKIIFGVNNFSQLKSIINVINKKKLVHVPKHFSIYNQKLINPSNWKS